MLRVQKCPAVMSVMRDSVNSTFRQELIVAKQCLLHRVKTACSLPMMWLLCKQAGGQEGRSLEPHFGSQAAANAAGAVSGWFSRRSSQPQDPGPPPDLTLHSAIKAVKQAIQASAA